jgi:ribosomal protein L35
MKTNKSLAKRIRITKNGKLKARKPGFNHFNAKQSRTKQLQGKTPIDFALSNKLRGRFFPHANIRIRKNKVTKVTDNK